MSTSSSKSKNLRSCVDCRKRENPSALLRVVCIDGNVIPDPQRTSPGRGAWVHPLCAVRAVKRGSFRWAFRREQSVDGSELLAYISSVESRK
ncbi:MAG TPA: YlxR family protein [Candidatus Paceibacterota bacterium]|nr:YlxR family protein [Candidatus Paceibacterota bacterium]